MVTTTSDALVTPATEPALSAPSDTSPLDRFIAHIMHSKLMTLGLQVAGHALAHVSKPDKSRDAHCRFALAQLQSCCFAKQLALLLLSASS
jgi:hypothetical protein